MTPVLRTGALCCTAALLLLASCADKGHAPNLVLDGSMDVDGSTPDDGGSILPDGSSTYPDGGAISTCGRPGDRGNQFGVGKYCEQLSDCPGQTICTASVNTPSTPATNSFFCTLPCTPCSGGPNACGAGAECGCSAGLGGCACVPTSCTDLWSTFDPMGACLPDGGMLPPDGGHPDGGVITVDGGLLPDAGSRPDGGLLGQDGGIVVADAGTVTVDAGPLPPQPVGGTCAADTDCQTGTCLTQFPGGYCSQDCSNGATCASGTCQFVPGVGQRCVQECGADSDCRDGYSCPIWPRVCTPAYCSGDWQCGSGKTCDPVTNICTSGPPGCRNSADCDPGQTCDSTSHCAGSTPPGCTSASDCPSGETCVASTSLCSGGNSAGPGAGKVGASCTRSSNCTQVNRGFCLTEQQANFSGGYCSGNCSADSDCGMGNVCAKLHDQNGNVVSLCAQGCAQNNDCRPRYNCVQTNGMSFCLNSCVENSDCVDPTTQTCNPTTGLCQ